MPRFYDAEHTPNQARRALSGLDNPLIPNSIEELYKNPPEVVREIQESMKPLLDTLEESRRVCERVFATTDNGNEQLDEKTQAQMNILLRIEAWSQEPEISVWKRGLVQSVKDMKEALGGFKSSGPNLASINYREVNPDMKRIEQDYGLDFRSQVPTRSVLTGAYKTSDELDSYRSEGKAGDIVDAAVAAGKALETEEGIAALEELKESIETQTSRAKEAVQELEDYLSDLETEEVDDQQDSEEVDDQQDSE